MKYIDSTQLVQIARGDKERMLKYLTQFEELIPQRIEHLKERLAEEDRRSVRQILHQMSPQLQFFGIPDVVEPIQNLATQYETIPISELHELVLFIIHQLEHAMEEIQQLKHNI